MDPEANFLSVISSIKYRKLTLNVFNELIMIIRRTVLYCTVRYNAVYLSPLYSTILYFFLCNPHFLHDRVPTLTKLHIR